MKTRKAAPRERHTKAARLLRAAKVATVATLKEKVATVVTVEEDNEELQAGAEDDENLNAEDGEGNVSEDDD